MYSSKTIVTNKSGLHARPASQFVQEANKYKSEIMISNLDIQEDKFVNAKSIIGVLSLGMIAGTNVEIRANGEDEETAVNHLIALIDSGFGE